MYIYIEYLWINSSVTFFSFSFFFLVLLAFLSMLAGIEIISSSMQFPCFFVILVNFFFNIINNIKNINNIIPPSLNIIVLYDLLLFLSACLLN